MEEHDFAKLEWRVYKGPGMARLAQVHVGLNERTEALDRQEDARAERAADLARVGVRPVFASLRTEPRFLALLKSIGLVDQ